MMKFRPRKEPSTPPSTVDQKNSPQNWLTVSQVFKVLVGSGVMLFVCNLCYDAAQATLLRRMQLEAENKQLRAQLERIDHKILPRIEQAHHEVKDIQTPLQYDKLTRTQQEQLALKARGVCEALEEIEHMLKLNTVARVDKKRELELDDIFIVLPNAASAATVKNSQRRIGKSLATVPPAAEPAKPPATPENLAIERARPSRATATAEPPIANNDAAFTPSPLAGIEKNLSFLGLPELPKSRKSADMHRVILEHLASLQDCYSRVLKESPQLNGEIKVRLTISPKGKVVAVALLASTVNHHELEQLILERISRWNDFGEVSPAAGNVTFKQTFILQ